MNKKCPRALLDTKEREMATKKKTIKRATTKTKTKTVRKTTTRSATKTAVKPKARATTKTKVKAKSTTTKKSAKTAFMKPMGLSRELEAVVGKGPKPRTEVTKKLWDYIKKNKLQDPSNKRNIKPDDKLADVFGSKKTISMFQMTKLVSKHLA